MTPGTEQIPGSLYSGLPGIHWVDSPLDVIRGVLSTTPTVGPGIERLLPGMSLMRKAPDTHKKFLHLQAVSSRLRHSPSGDLGDESSLVPKKPVLWFHRPSLPALEESIFRMNLEHAT